jgi:hypothetical protein
MTETTPKSGARPPTWCGVVAVWLVATAVLMVVALPVSGFPCAVSYANIGVWMVRGGVMVDVNVPWEPDFAEPPIVVLHGWKAVRLGGMPSVDTNADLVFRTELVEVYVPLWLLAVIGGGFIAFVWRAARRRRVRGVCACGYSLVGLGEGAVCPECGRKSTA